MKYSAFLALFLLVYLILFRPIRKRVYKTIADIPQLLGPEETRKSLAEGGAEKALTESTGAALPAAAAGTAEQTGSVESQIEQELMQEAEPVNPEMQKYEALKKRVIEHASSEPEQLSQLIRTWIHEH